MITKHLNTIILIVLMLSVVIIISKMLSLSTNLKIINTKLNKADTELNILSESLKLTNDELTSLFLVLQSVIEKSDSLQANRDSLVINYIDKIKSNYSMLADMKKENRLLKTRLNKLRTENELFQ